VVLISTCCISVEAPRMLLCVHELPTYLHLVIWQIGCVGDSGFRFEGFANNKFSILADYLQARYPKDHPVFLYTAANVPLCQPNIYRCTIGRLSKSEVASQVTGLSTMYIPPAHTISHNETMLQKLSLAGHPIVNKKEAEERIVKELKNFEIPEGYKSHTNSNLLRLLCDVADKKGKLANI